MHESEPRVMLQGFFVFLVHKVHICTPWCILEAAQYEENMGSALEQAMPCADVRHVADKMLQIIPPSIGV